MNAAGNGKALDTATTLAFERTRIAYERTMMAWIRTATSLITFGFSVYKFFEIEMQTAPRHRDAPRPARVRPCVDRHRAAVTRRSARSSTRAT